MRSEIIHKTRNVAAIIAESMPKDARLITGQNFEKGQSGKPRWLRGMHAATEGRNVFGAVGIE